MAVIKSQHTGSTPSYKWLSSCCKDVLPQFFFSPPSPASINQSLCHCTCFSCPLFVHFRQYVQPQKLCLNASRKKRKEKKRKKKTERGLFTLSLLRLRKTRLTAGNPAGTSPLRQLQGWLSSRLICMRGCSSLCSHLYTVCSAAATAEC